LRELREDASMFDTSLIVEILLCVVGALYGVANYQLYMHSIRLVHELPNMFWVSFDDVVNKYECPRFYALLILPFLVEQEVLEARLATDAPDWIVKRLKKGLRLRHDSAPYFKYKMVRKYPRRPRRVERAEVKKPEWSGLPVPA